MPNSVSQFDPGQSHFRKMPAAGVLRLGTVALDGTKIHANASRHSALSYEHATKIETQLKAEVADLLGKAEAADQAEVPDGMQVPEELADQRVGDFRLGGLVGRIQISSPAREPEFAGGRRRRFNLGGLVAHGQLLGVAAGGT